MKVSIHYKRGKKVGIHPKPLIDYSRAIDDVYETLEDCNPKRKRRV